MASLVPYSGSSDDDQGEAPPDSKRARRPGGFFAAGGDDWSEEDDSPSASDADEPPAEDRGATEAVAPASLILPPVVDLLASTGRPQWLDAPLGERLVPLPHDAPVQRPVHSTVGSAPVAYTQAEQASRAQLTALRQELALDSAKDRGRSSHAMPVEEALANPSLTLPRKAQDRKEREKSKRERGQSSISTWKSEAEMVLRQQYDS
jgi:hypothetical protein